jgi:hypothetical protein
MAEVPMDIKLTIEEIYKVLCPECKQKLLSLAAKSAALDAIEKIEKQLKEQWEEKTKK